MNDGEDLIWSCNDAPNCDTVTLHTTAIRNLKKISK